MSEGNWPSQVTARLGRPLALDEFADASRDFASMDPAFRANEFYVLDFIQHVVASCRDNDRYEARFKETTTEMDRHAKSLADLSAGEMRFEISKAVKSAFERLQSASPNMELARRRVAWWTAGLFAYSTV